MDRWLGKVMALLKVELRVLWWAVMLEIHMVVLSVDLTAFEMAV